MKKLVILFAALLTASSALHADDVALMKIRVNKSKELLPVAIEFYEGDTPAHVANFKKLASKKFYNGLAFHRAFPHLLMQTGDPISRSSNRTRVGIGGPGYTLPPEIHRKNIKGAVAAARLPDKINPSRVSNGSQFYICLAPMPAYDGQYTVFGHVLYGLDTLDTLSTRSVDSNDNPVERIEIDSVKIMPREQLPPPPAPPVPGAKPKAKRWWQIF